MRHVVQTYLTGLRVKTARYKGLLHGYFSELYGIVYAALHRNIIYRYLTEIYVSKYTDRIRDSYTICLALALLLLVTILKPDLSKPLIPTTRLVGRPELDNHQSVFVY